MADICKAFTNFIIDQLPFYEELILSDIRLTDSWVGNYNTGTWPSGTGVEHTIDRMRHVFPNTTKTWTAVAYASCIGTPCDVLEHKIGWGSERKTFALEKQSWATDLLCFDQLRHISHAEEQWGYILSDILRPATNAIQSNFMRKRTLFHASKKYQVNSSMPQFTYVWTVVGDEEIYFDCSCAPGATYKLAPQYLQVRFAPLMNVGYAGKNPYKETAPFIELVTDMETAWELEKLGGSQGVGGTPSIAANWRFTQFDATSNYWKYGFSGQIGNFMVRVDTMALRFTFVQDRGAGSAPNRYRYQVVLPYINSTAAGAGSDPGLGSDDNPLFHLAPYTITFITHKKGLTMLTSDTSTINPEMPFMHRSLAGKWQFVMDNLTCGSDVNGNPIAVDNSRRNKGKFIADFEQAIRPEYTEFINAFFHKREPMCLPQIQTCTTDPGYPSQVYTSANNRCP